MSKVNSNPPKQPPNGPRELRDGLQGKHKSIPTPKDRQTSAEATPAYAAALLVSLIAGLAVAAGAKFGLGVSGVVTVVIAVAVFLPVMAGVLLFNVAAKPTMVKRLGRSAFWLMNAYGLLSLVIAVLTISSAFFGKPMNLRDQIIKSGEAGDSKIAGEMTADVHDLCERGREAWNSKDLEESLRLFTQALSKDPENYILLANRSAVYLMLKRNTEALFDAEKARNAYTKLGEQQLHREKAYKLILDNTLINAYFKVGKFEDVTAIYTGAKPHIQDVADTITRIYFSAANAALAQQQWQTARDIFYKILSMARTLDNYEMEVKSYLNIAIAAYQLDSAAVRKSVAELDEGLEAIKLYKFTDEEKCLLTTQFYNAKGLALHKLHYINPEGVLKSQAEEEYNRGIELLQKCKLASEEAKRTHVDLLGNLANVQRERKAFQKSMKNYRIAIGTFMAFGYRDGISRQAYGLGRIFLDSEPPLYDAKKAFACALFAIKLGHTKPLEEKNADQQLMVEASECLKQVEQRAVSQQLHEFAGKAFKVRPDRLKLYLQ